MEIQFLKLFYKVNVFLLVFLSVFLIIYLQNELNKFNFLSHIDPKNVKNVNFANKRVNTITVFKMYTTTECNLAIILNFN